MPCPQKPAAPLTPRSLIALMWLASPALPVGAFSYSEGLEAATDAGHVHDEASAQAWLLDQSALCLARADLAVVAGAWRAFARDDRERVVELNDWFVLTRETSEGRQQTLQMGRSLTAWLRQRAADDGRVAWLESLAPAPTWPLAFALGAVQTGAPLLESLLAFGFGWAEAMVQAAVRVVPLGQSAGQRLLSALANVLPACAETAAQADEATRQSFAPMLAILSSRHEAQYTRLFRS